MSSLTIPDISPTLLEELRRLAVEHGRSLEDEARERLLASLASARPRALAEADRFRASFGERRLEDGVALLRELRER